MFLPRIHLTLVFCRPKRSFSKHCPQFTWHTMSSFNNSSSASASAPPNNGVRNMTLSNNTQRMDTDDDSDRGDMTEDELRQWRSQQPAPRRRDPSAAAAAAAAAEAAAAEYREDVLQERVEEAIKRGIEEGLRKGKRHIDVDDDDDKDYVDEQESRGRSNSRGSKASSRASSRSSGKSNDNRFPSKRGNKSAVRRDNETNIRRLVGQLRLLPNGTTDISGNHTVLRDFEIAAATKSLKEVSAILADLFELKSSITSDPVALLMNETAAELRGTPYAGIVDNMKTASDADILKQVAECQNLIDSKEREVKLLKKCKQYMLSTMDRKMDDQDAIHTLIAIYTARRTMCELGVK